MRASGFMPGYLRSRAEYSRGIALFVFKLRIRSTPAGQIRVFLQACRLSGSLLELPTLTPESKWRCIHADVAHSHHHSTGWVLGQ